VTRVNATLRVRRRAVGAINRAFWAFVRAQHDPLREQRALVQARPAIRELARLTQRWSITPRGRAALLEANRGQ
jgi:hypothetical protein